MAVQDASTTSANTQGDVRRRNVGTDQANGSYIPQEIDDKLDKKTKQKVGPDEAAQPCHTWADTAELEKLT